jgi:membrane fusion protein, multidrug efflux system
MTTEQPKLVYVPATPRQSQVTASESAKPRGRSRRLWLLGLGALALIALIVVGVRYLIYAMAHESTDDAFIDVHYVPISPKVANYVAKVHVNDNQHVQKGDLLLELDPRDFEAALAQARANLAAAIAQHRAAQLNVEVTQATTGGNLQQADFGVRAAERQIEQARSQLAQAQAKVAAAEAEATRARLDVGRYEELVPYGAVTQQERDQAQATNATAQANLDAARKAEQAAADTLRLTQAQHGEAVGRLNNAKAAPNQVAYSRAQADAAAAHIAQLEAAVRQAELNLSYTKITAPESGKITRKNIEPGAYVQVGQTVFSIVPDRVWVTANFKETQLRYMRAGQPVTVYVDAYPNRPFKGHVDSIQSGSGAAFSLLPPENATGNYVKVVQRVPVKILIDEPPDPNYVLGPGMSVVPVVKVR